MLSQNDSLEAAINQNASDINDLEAAISSLGSVSLEFSEGANAGAPIRVSPAGLARNAVATSADGARVVGLAGAAVTAGNSAAVVLGNRLSMANWTNITGSTSLIPGSNYFLGSTAGKMSLVPPSAAGSVVVRVGYAVTTEIFQVDITVWVLL
jgi:hypothetical protein